MSGRRKRRPPAGSPVRHVCVGRKTHRGTVYQAHVALPISPETAEALDALADTVAAMDEAEIQTRRNQLREDDR